MKILVIIPSFPKYSGVDYHRLVQPHKRITELFSNECEIFQINEIDTATIEFLQGFDICVANRFISKTGDIDNLIAKLKLANLPYLIDIDDDYRLPEWHILHLFSSKEGHPQKIIKGINNATAVTCTQALLKSIIKKESLQKNVFIAQNGIYPTEQFSVKEFKTDKLTFGWSGSITHFDDVLELFESLLPMYNDEILNKKFRFVYGGFDSNDQTSRAIAGVLSAKGKATQENFSMFPASGVTSYGNFYDTIHVSLIPLRNNRFNNLKSNLKLIESGFKKKAVICSDVYPYSPMLKHRENCLVVKKKSDWYRHMVYLINNPNMASDLAEKLYEDVQCQHIDIVAQERFNIYKSILNV